MPPPRQCPPGKILNPATNRCVNVDGRVGREVLRQLTNAERQAVMNNYHRRTGVDDIARRMGNVRIDDERAERAAAARAATVRAATNRAAAGLFGGKAARDQLQRWLDTPIHDQWGTFKLYGDNPGVVDSAARLADNHAALTRAEGVGRAVLAACLLVAYKLVNVSRHVPPLDVLAQLTGVPAATIVAAERDVLHASDWRLMPIVNERFRPG